MSSIQRLLDVLPSWVILVSNTHTSAEIKANPRLADGSNFEKFDLKLELAQEKGVAVFENPIGTSLPKCCIERHINSDGSFCVFLGSQLEIPDTDEAKNWWGSLEIYLGNQLHAAKYGIWPAKSGLSHGDAANIQLKMEEIAEPLGWYDEIQQSMFRSKGWLAGELPRISKDRSVLLNSRSPCPRGCLRKHKLLQKRSCERSDCYPNCQRQHNPILRSTCLHRRAVEQLVILEYERRRIENGYVEELRKSGINCCGTMKNCLLRSN